MARKNHDAAVENDPVYTEEAPSGEVTGAVHLNGAAVRKTREKLSKREAVVAIFRVFDRCDTTPDEILASVAALR